MIFFNVSLLLELTKITSHIPQWLLLPVDQDCLGLLTSTGSSSRTSAPLLSSSRRTHRAVNVSWPLRCVVASWTKAAFLNSKLNIIYYFTYPSKSKFTAENLSGIRVECDQSGSMTRHTFPKWCRHFVDHLPEGMGGPDGLPVMLFIDGPYGNLHSSYHCFLIISLDRSYFTLVIRGSSIPTRQ